jgi:adenylylsulfate kinase
MHDGVSRQQRSLHTNQKGFTVWFTGLSASGKSTIASALELALLQRGSNAYRLDGDNIRLGLNKNLGFSPEDRSENIRRIAEVAVLFADSTTVTLTSFISPYRNDRNLARKLHEEKGLSFIEVYVDIPLSEAERRDPKGLYAKARSGIIKQFTGVDSPYEHPISPEVHIRNDQTTVQQGVDILIQYLVKSNLIPENSEHDKRKKSISDCGSSDYGTNESSDN